MNQACLTILLGAIFLAGSAVQAQTGALAGGTTLSAELSATVDSKKAKTGDPVMARTTEAVKAGGELLIPKGAKLVGHVTQASARAKGDTQSALAIQFDKAVLKNGQELPLRLWLGAIAAEPRSSYQPGPEPSALAGTPGAGESPMGASRSTAGGVNANGGAAPGAVTNTVTSAGGSVSAADRTAAAAGGLSAAGQLTSNSRGVFGLDGVHLATDTSSATQGSLITSSGKNVRLDSGTRLLLVLQAEVSAPTSK